MARCVVQGGVFLHIFLDSLSHLAFILLSSLRLMDIVELVALLIFGERFMIGSLG